MGPKLTYLPIILFHAAHFRGLDVAVKVLRSGILDDTSIERFRAEMNMLARLQHPNVCMFIGYQLQPELCVVMEYCSGGDLGTAASRLGPIEKVSPYLLE